SILSVRPDVGDVVRVDNHQSSTADVSQVHLLAGFPDSFDAVDEQIAAPQILFLFAMNEAKKVDSNCGVVRGLEVERGKGNGDRRGPPVIGDMSIGFPDTIPIGVIDPTLIRD